MLAMFSLQACLISCKDNGTEGNLDTTMLVMSSDGGKRSFPVSSDAHISYIQDKKTLVYKECENNDSVSLETVGYNYFKAYISRQRLFVEIGKNRELQEQHFIVSYRDFDEENKLDITLDKADSCVIDTVKYMEKLSASPCFEKQDIKIHSEEGKSQVTVYPLSDAYALLAFDKAHEIEKLLPLGVNSKINVPMINGLKDEKKIFGSSVRIPITEEFWKSCSFEVSSSGDAISDNVSIYVGYIEEKINTEVVVRNFTQNTHLYVKGIATLRYPTGTCKLEK